MKTKLFIGITLIASVLSCSQKKSGTATTDSSAARTALPEVLQNHSEKEAFTALTGSDAKPIALFNGKNLSGWYIFTQQYGPDNDVENQFLIEDGVLHLDGQPMGYVCTRNSYGNYYLKVVFRWGEKKYPPREDHVRDSGVLYHIPDTVSNKLWPIAVEYQIQEGDCGDYWLIGTTGDSPNAQESTPGRFIRTANYENPAGEWNTVEIICYDNKSEHYLNGHLVNQASNLNVSEGKILLQLEGAEIFYQTVEMWKLK
ncbi:MAG: DUF1080 domain-containing protein [Tannerella sp.]|jgi:hypothetical protein|nr:DUF1080 domain-containing protein [Tannerella sp.]